jgi:hypothetical protein
MNFTDFLGSINLKQSKNRQSNFITVNRSPLSWTKLPQEVDDGFNLFSSSKGHRQAESVKFQMAFQPEISGYYDVEWIVEPGIKLEPGSAVIHVYRASDGYPFIQKIPFSANTCEILVERNRKVTSGDLLLTCELPEFHLDSGQFKELFKTSQFDIAQAVNAALKGHMASTGIGGQTTKTIHPVRCELHPEQGYSKVKAEIVHFISEANISDGDTIVISEKILAIAQNRLFPLEIIADNDPKTTDAEGRKEIISSVKRYVDNVTSTDLICSDYLEDYPKGAMATAGTHDPNTVAFDLSKAIFEKTGITCDTIITDTDTGLDVRETLIGHITIGATPLGATAGLALYECMRIAVAAEYCRGSSRGIPMVICKPHLRRQYREGLGEFRGYSGRLNSDKEPIIGFA